LNKDNSHKKTYPRTLVTGDIRFVQILTGIPKKGATNWQQQNYQCFRSLYLWNFHT